MIANMSEFKNRFEQKLNDVLKSKKDNATIPRLEKRESWIEILLALEATSSKSNDYYNLKKRYEVLRVGEADRLIRKRKGDVHEKLLSLSDVPDVELPLRTAITRYTGGQGYVKCACKSNCKTSRCSCKKKRIDVQLSLPSRF